MAMIVSPALPTVEVDRSDDFKECVIAVDMSVKEIAASLNFEDTPYMCRYFRQRTGLSPTEYRNNSTKP